MKNTISRLVIALVAAHAAAFIALHLLEGHLSPVSSIISDYAATESRWIASLSFVFFAGIWALFAVILPGRNLLINTGRGLFLIAAIFILVGTMLPESMDPRTGSLLSRVQNLFARPGLFIGIVLVSVGLHKTRGWEAQAKILVGLSVTALALLLLSVMVLLEVGLAGVGQRLIFALLYGWATITALAIRGQADSTATEAA